MKPIARLSDPFSCGSFIGAGAASVYSDNLPVARLGDLVLPHGCFSASNIVGPVSATVIVEGIPAAMVGSANAPHACPPVVHSGVLVAGSPTVFIS